MYARCIIASLSFAAISGARGHVYGRSFQPRHEFYLHHLTLVLIHGTLGIMPLLACYSSLPSWIKMSLLEGILMF